MYSKYTLLVHPCQYERFARSNILIGSQMSETVKRTFENDTFRLHL